MILIYVNTLIFDILSLAEKGNIWVIAANIPL